MTLEELCEKLNIDWEVYLKDMAVLGYELRVRRMGMPTQGIKDVTVDDENDYIIIEIA